MTRVCSTRARLLRQTQPDQALERRVILQQVLGVRAVHGLPRSSTIASAFDDKATSA
jgi:hypothetical protein